jgi:hypothetical protein
VIDPGSMARRPPRNPVDEPDSQHSSGILSVHQPVVNDGNGCPRAIRFGDCTGVPVAAHFPASALVDQVVPPKVVPSQFCRLSGSDSLGWVEVVSHSFLLFVSGSFAGFRSHNRHHSHCIHHPLPAPTHRQWRYVSMIRPSCPMVCRMFDSASSKTRRANPSGTLLP